jgi:hypothetical protein
VSSLFREVTSKQEGYDAAPSSRLVTVLDSQIEIFDLGRVAHSFY